jgi:hypothetical protein
MYEKKQIINKSPDTRKLQEVIIDDRTKIYIDIDADPVEARNRFMARILAKNSVMQYGRKPATSKS